MGLMSTMKGICSQIKKLSIGDVWLNIQKTQEKQIKFQEYHFITFQSTFKIDFKLIDFQL